MNAFATLNLTKFLTIDAGLLLIGLAVFFIIQNRNSRNLFIGNFAEKSKNNPYINLPNKERLIELEKIAQKNSSGIEFDSLIGTWAFHSVWQPKSDKQNDIASSLLRLFSAKLELKRNGSDKLAITNSIRFGLLIIRFSGIGKLRGRQPLLPFFFESIELIANSTVLISRPLETPEEEKQPFFALISMEENGKWLSARGRGGGLALWLRE